MNRAIVWLVMLFLPLALIYPVRAETPVDDVASQVVCQCGCNSVLNNCVHGECMVRDQMLASIRSAVNKGNSKEAIIQMLVAQYGEQVLAAPTKEGFNLTAWVIPFAAILLGAALIYLLLRAWLRWGREEEVTVPMADTDEEYRRRLDDELARFKKREGYW
ncbi:MAG: cytochrome c-type biogenesis protein CcmH [Chloroflexi bacterium]|nr:cytochrome c-type biogenesis protein CcmH [Chloroflexota bacterium]